jgi:LuxR family maltose regulon positive regulatory protein
MAAVFPNILGQIYTYIYLAAANGRIFRDAEARATLIQALEMALPDKVYMPFVENCEYIRPILEEFRSQGIYTEDIDRILDIYKAYQKAMVKIKESFITEDKQSLTGREEQIAQLAADGLSNKEIGVRLFISQNTVKTQLKSIFEKLGISSRVLLKDYFEKKV